MGVIDSSSPKGGKGKMSGGMEGVVRNSDINFDLVLRINQLQY
jgi:hypothetical protein